MQRNDGSLGNLYIRFNKELVRIDQVHQGGETIRAFLRALGLKRCTLYDNLIVIPVNTIEEMDSRVKVTQGNEEGAPREETVVTTSVEDEV